MDACQEASKHVNSRPNIRYCVKVCILRWPGNDGDDDNDDNNDG